MSMELKRNRKSNIPYSLHDSRIINMEYKKRLLRLKLNKIFQYTEEAELIYSGEIAFTECDIDDCNIFLFDKIVYEGSFAGKAMTLADYMKQYLNAEFEILTEGYSECSTVYSEWIRQEDKEPVSGILNIYNTGEIIYRLDT